MEKFIWSDLVACESESVDMDIERFLKLDHFKDWVMKTLNTEDVEYALDKVNTEIYLVREYLAENYQSYSSYVDGYALLTYGIYSLLDKESVLTFKLEESTAGWLDVPATKMSFRIVKDDSVIVDMTSPQEHTVFDEAVEDVSEMTLTEIGQIVNVGLESAFRNYTDNAIESLQYLQNRLNRQDNWGNADPVYWGIKDVVETVVAPGDGDYDVITDFDSTYTLEEFINALVESFEENGLELEYYFNEEETYEIHCCLEYREDVVNPCLEQIVIEVKDVAERHLDAAMAISDFIEVDNMQVFGISENFVIKESVIFLTSLEAQSHLDSNAHHYSDRAFVYAMTAFRSPSVELVWEALRTMDFDYIIEALSHMD